MGQKAQKQRLGRNPARQSTHTRHILEGLNPLLEFEVPKIFLNHVRHGHTQGRRKVLHGHGVLFFRILEQLVQAVCQALGTPRRIELDC